jgi:hypothetical protein
MRYVSRSIYIAKQIHHQIKLSKLEEAVIFVLKGKATVMCRNKIILDISMCFRQLNVHK